MAGAPPWPASNISHHQLLSMGEAAVLVEHEEPLAVAAALAVSPAPGQLDVVPAESTVLVVVAEGSDLTAVRRHLLELQVGACAERSARTVEIEVIYDGADLSAVAGLLGVAADELVRRHTSVRWVVGFVGFAPGFGYLTSEEWDYDVPRLAQPRTAIPAGSIAIAHRYSGVYPRASPGGWQLIGSTSANMWDLNREQPALLTPGTVVRFRESPPSAVRSTERATEATVRAGER